MDEMFEVGDVRSTVTQVEGKVWERDDDYKIVWADGQVDVFEDRELMALFLDGTLVQA
jgi:hypothetical protein